MKMMVDGDGGLNPGDGGSSPTFFLLLFILYLYFLFSVLGLLFSQFSPLFVRLLCFFEKKPGERKSALSFSSVPLGSALLFSPPLSPLVLSSLYLPSQLFSSSLVLSPLRIPCGRPCLCFNAGIKAAVVVFFSGEEYEHC